MFKFYSPPHRLKSWRLILVFSLGFTLFINANQLQAQTYAGGGAAAYINPQLRAMFELLQPPNPQAPFLFDMVAHVADPSWYTHYNTNVSSTPNFATILEEIYYAHYDTTDFDRVDTLFERAGQFPPGEVVLGLIDYDFHRFKDSILYDTIWFDIDTLEGKLIDNPNRPNSPYHTENIFMVGAFQDISYEGSMDYRIDPDFLMIDQANLPDYNTYDLQFDFDDGTGWHMIDPTVVTLHHVDYSSSGQKVIKARLVDPTDSKLPPAKYSASFRVAPEADQNTPPNQTWNLPGMNVGVYPACEVEGENAAQKFLILVEGFDFGENHDPAEIYEDMAVDTDIADLRNYGYTILTVDWKDSKKSIAVNALHLRGLIDQLKCDELPGLPDTPEQQFVIIGSSMGGLIAKYCLSMMEATPNLSQCRPDLMHNTRLLITLDTPHKGAYIPLAFQELYRSANPFQGLPYNYVGKHLGLLNIMNSPAAREMLILHATTNVGVSTLYLPHPARLTHLASYLALNPQNNGNPERCKIMAISSGLLTGEHQSVQDNSCVLSPQDKYLDMSVETHLHFFGIQVLGTGNALELSTVSNGYEFYRHGLFVNHWGVKLKWKKIGIGPFSITVPDGLEVGLVSDHILNKTKTCTGQPSYGIMPGGFSWNTLGTISGANVNLYLGPESPTWRDPMVLNFQINLTNTGQSSCNPQTLIDDGLGLMAVGFNISATSQGEKFCFIPLQSSLDYDAQVPEDHDIFGDPIGLTMTRTPFDVIMGPFNGEQNYPANTHDVVDQNLNTVTWRGIDEHRVHTAFNNHMFPALDETLREAGDPADLDDNIRALVVNREIGDRALWIENFDPLRSVFLEAEEELIGGTLLNPYYAYDGTPMPQRVETYDPILNAWQGNFIHNGVISRDLPFNSTNTVLRAGVVNAAGVTGNPPVIILDEMLICDEDFLRIDPQFEIPQEELPGLKEMVVYPNPNAGFAATIAYHFEQEGDLELHITDLTGRSTQLQLPAMDKSGSFEIDLSNMSNGVYLITLIHNGQSVHSKLVVNR